MGSGIKRADLAFIYTSGVSLSSLASHEEEKRSEAWVEKAESEHARRSQFLGIDCARASEQQLRARAVRPRATRHTAPTQRLPVRRSAPDFRFIARCARATPLPVVGDRDRLVRAVLDSGHPFHRPSRAISSVHFPCASDAASHATVARGQELATVYGFSPERANKQGLLS